MKQCLSILLAFSILAPASFAADTKTSAAPITPVAADASVVAPAVPAGTQDKPRVFVTDEPLQEDNSIVRGNVSTGHVENGPNARVVEIQADLIKVCPKVMVTNRADTADYTVLFRRDNSKRSSMFAFGGLAGLALSAASKVNGASLFAANGDLITATQQRTVENAIRELCASIPATVVHSAAQPAPVQASAQNADMPAPLPIPAPVAEPAPVQAAVAEVVINSAPDGADIEIDGGFVGNTPSSIETSVGEHQVVIHKKGFKDWGRKVKVSGGSITLRAELDPAS